MAKINNIVGEPDLSFIPPHIKFGRLPPALAELMVYGYDIDRQGLPETLKAVADYYNRFNGLGADNAIKPAQILMAGGARSAATVIATYIINHYEERGMREKQRVLLLKPGYNLYNEQFHSLGFAFDTLHLGKGISDDEKLAEIEKAITPQTVILPICNPNNPTGEIYSVRFMRGLLGLLDKFPHLNIINDSVYDHIVRAGTPQPASIFTLANPEQRSRVFEVNSLAKSYSYPAIRAGWAIGDEDIIAKIQETKDPMLGPLPNISQLVTIAALHHTHLLIPDYHEQVNAVYDRRLQLVHDKLHQIKGFDTIMPQGAFYYFADFSGVEGIRAPEIIKELADMGIMVSAGTKFGDPEAIRINCGAKAAVLETICDAMIDICRARNIAIEDHNISPVPKLLDEVSFGENLITR